MSAPRGLAAVLFASGLLAAFPAPAALPLVLDASGQCDWAGALDILPDPDGRLDPAQAAARSDGWAAPGPKAREIPPGTYWGRLALESNVERATAFVLVPDPRWHRVELYSDPAALPEQVTGAALPLARRALAQVRPVLPLLAEPGVRRELLVRFVALPDRHFRPARFVVGCESLVGHFARGLRERHLHGIYGGLMLAIVTYNLFLWFSVRDRIYLLYVLYAGSFASIWLVMAGVGLDLLWPSWPAWDEVSIFVLSVLAVVFGNLFVKTFLQLAERQRAVSRLLDGASAASVGLGALALAGRWDLAMDPLALVALAVVALYLVAGVRALRAGFGPARIFLVACGALLAGTALYILAFFGLLPFNFTTQYGAQIGSAFEMVLLAFALGSRIRALESERRESEDRYRLRLEHEVEERTASLAAEKQRADDARHQAEEANSLLVDANRRLERITLVDGLTGVSNRRHFDQLLESEWRRAQRLRLPIAVVLFDVDHFKAFNDLYGHVAGDDCLRRVAATLADLARRSSDLVARYGGEEFGVVLPATDLASAVALAEQARAAVAGLEIEHGGAPRLGRLTLSAGVACRIPDLGVQPSALLAAADAALYAAKHGGRNRVEVSDPPPGLPAGPG